MTARRAGVVIAVLPGNLVNVQSGTTGGSDPSSGYIPNVPYVPGYAPQIGDSVVIDYLVNQPYVAMCLTPNRALASNVTVVNTNPGGLTAISTVLTDPSTSINPAITLVRTTPVTGASSITATPVSSGTWSPDWPAWRTDNSKVSQGSYGSGEQYGLWFYGASAFAGLAGHTVTGVTMTVKRDSSGGTSWGPMQLHFYLHTNTTKPGSGPPTISLGPVDVAAASPSLGQTVTFALPTAWGVLLQAGTYAGVGIASAATADAVTVLGPADSATSGQLVITYV